MAKAYSEDFREAVIKYLEDGHSKSETSLIFGVDRRTIYSWQKLKEKQGHLRRKPPYKIKYRKMNPEKLIEFIQQNPDFTLIEIGDHFGVSGTSVYDACKKLKITRKKKL
jgi:transposase